MTARDGYDLLMLLDSQDAVIREQAAVISKERSETDLLLEKVANLEAARLTERKFWDSDVRRAYQLGRSERRIRGGLFAGYDILDQEGSVGLGVVLPLTP
jgi:hypothetical protein